MSIPITVETDRLILRSIGLADVTDRYSGWLRDEEVTRYLEARFDSHDMESLRSYVQRQLADPSIVFAAIVEKPDRFIGTIKLGPIDPHHRRADVGIMIGERDAWGRGYATEAIRALCTFAFEVLGVKRLAAGTYAVNSGSIKAFTRAGFQVEGVLRSSATLGAGRVGVTLMGLVAEPSEPGSSGVDASTASPDEPYLTGSAQAPSTRQRDAFLRGEGDEWFKRNPDPARRAGEDEARVASHILPSASVLEVGCADGRWLAAISRLVPARYAGIDPSTLAIDAGRRRYPYLDLRVATADSLPFGTEFDVVILGFCLYMCDRSLLPRIVSEVDRVLRDGGTLVVKDFDPRFPRRRAYRQSPGLWSWKMDYAALFLAFPSYTLAEKHSFRHDGEGWTFDETARVAINVLKKSLPGAYSVEPDE